MGHPPGPVRNGHRVWHPPSISSGECVGGITGDTRVVTEWGLIPVEQLVTEPSISVLDGHGRWNKATVLRGRDDFVWNLTVERNRLRQVIRTAAGQLFSINSPARRMYGRAPLLFRTDALSTVVGSRTWKLVTVNPPRPVTLDGDAVLHGIVFGDGTYYRQASGRRHSCHIYLCNDPNGCDSRKLAALFEAVGFKPVVREDKGQIRFYGLPAHWKMLPPADSSPGYLRGFVAGWFAADGHVDHRAPVATLASANRDWLEWLQRIAPRAGLAVSTTIGKRRCQSTFGPSEWFSLGISATTLDAEFFPMAEKRARFRAAAFLKQWKIVSVVPTNTAESLFHVAGDSGHFVIEGNIFAAGERVTVADNHLSDQ